MMVQGSRGDACGVSEPAVKLVPFNFFFISFCFYRVMYRSSFVSTYGVYFLVVSCATATLREVRRVIG